jgi:glycosyltransferase involved in cell wall biosynthesis
MKIAIYTISKNEEHNVFEFMKAAGDVPVYVVDTGSTDKTVELLKKHGAIVKQKIITPWRFDVARQEALGLVPDDVDLCVSVDMDERLESGWQEKLKQEWHPEANFGNYRYIGEWLDKAKTKPAIESARTRIHSRNGFHWERPVHEVLIADDPSDIKSCDTTVLVRHYSNNKQRNYAPLLTQILERDPNDADARLQRGGEFAQKGEWANALIDYECWLKLTYGDDRPVMRYRRATTHIALAHCYFYLNDQERCVRQFFAAIAAEPICREAWVHLAHIHNGMGNHALAYGMAMTALKIEKPPYYACTESFCWGDFPRKLAEQTFDKIVKEAA